MDTGLNVMAKVSWALTISVVAHGAAVVAVAAYDPEDEPREREHAALAIEVVAPPTASPTETIIAVDVSFLSAVSDVPVTDVAATAASDEALPTTSRRVSTGRGREAVGGVGTTGPDGGKGTGTTRNAYFDLRKGRVSLLHLVDGEFGSFDPSAGPGPEKQIKTGYLAQDGGTHVSRQGVFTARVEKDGNVSLKDAKNLNIRFALPRPKMIGNAFSEWYASDKGDDGQRGKRTLEKEVGGSIDTEDRSRSVVVPVLRGGFDITDGLMRKFGVGDPYASKKLAFLDATRDERAQIGAKYRAGQLAQTDILVRKNLEMLWSTVPDLAARKQALCELWDEAVETGDPKVVEAGAAARRQIVGFIRARLPVGSAHAFTSAELAACNAKKQSKQFFAPYE
jgi:hypothetical protein